MKKLLGQLVVFTYLFVVGCKNNDAPPEATIPPTPSIAYSVAATMPHDTSYFTEGLEFYKGLMLESTGLEGKSRLVQYDPTSGKVEKQVVLDSTHFGEGITVFRDTVYQLTYTQGVIHVYNINGLKKLKQLPYNNGEGWGLTHDSSHIIGTNGSNNIHYYEPGSFKLIKTLPVTENDLPAVNLNELEYVNRYIYANQWQYNTILKIDPANGKVVAKMDLSSIKEQEKALNPVAGDLNGIAYNPDTKKFYVTGKNWAKIYELQFSL